jgi:hypothetical protein
MRQTRNLRVEIRVTEESYRLTLGNDAFPLVDRLEGRGNDTVESRTEEVVAPASEKIGGIDDNSARLSKNN